MRFERVACPLGRSFGLSGVSVLDEPAEQVDELDFPRLGLSLRIDRRSHPSSISVHSRGNVRVACQKAVGGGVRFSVDVESVGNDFCPTRRDLHQMRSELHAINLGLQLYQCQREDGLTRQCNVTLLHIIEQLEALEQVQRTHQHGDAPPRRQCAGMDVLLVQSDHDERELLAGLLRMRGVGVHAVADLNAVDSPLFQTKSFVAILWDQQDMAGSPTAGNDAVFAARVPIITLVSAIAANSGAASGENRSSLDAAVEHRLPKPIAVDEVLKCLSLKRSD